MYDLISQDRTGVDGARNLPQYMKCSSNEQREELGAKSPFEVYFGGTHNELLKCGRQDGYTNQEEIRNVVPSSIKGRNSYKIELTPSGTNKLRSQ